MIINSILVAAGGFAGALARYAVALWLGRKVTSAIPWGTLLVNLTGSFLLGVVAGSLLSQTIGGLWFGTGLLGAFTTFSTFKLETLKLLMDNKRGIAVLYMAVTYCIGIGLAFAGYAAGRLLC